MKLWNAIPWTPMGEYGIRQFEKIALAAAQGLPASVVRKFIDARVVRVPRNRTQPRQGPRLLRVRPGHNGNAEPLEHPVGL